MDDKKIIELFWERKEDALTKTAEKYGGLCHYIAGNILKDPKDCEECVNDAYLSLWNAIPPQRPNRFSVFLGRIVKNLSLKRFAYVTAAKRNPGAVSSLEELCECVSGKETVESALENKRIEHLLDNFLWQQPVEKRNIFVRRYWYMDSIDAICRRTGYSQSKVKSMLFYLRKELRRYLEEEGVDL